MFAKKNRKKTKSRSQKKVWFNYQQKSKNLCIWYHAKNWLETFQINNLNFYADLNKKG